MNRALLLLLLSPLALGRTAPSFSGSLLGGGNFSLKDDLKKDRALLVCFWATWCAPCLEELRHVEKLVEEEKNLPLDVITVNVDTHETSTDVKLTVRVYGFKLPVLPDPSHQIFGKYASEKSLPYSVLVQPTGEIAATFQGYDEKMVAKIRESISTLGKGAKKDAR